MEAKYFAHSDPEAPGLVARFEPLFALDCSALSGGHCSACETLERRHGHLNKVAWWTARFTAGLFVSGSADSEAARQWGYLAGLWHDLGKFAPLWQQYLLDKSGASPQIRGPVPTIDHATAGAQHAVKANKTLGHLLAYAIAGHHSGLLDAISEHACQDKRLLGNVPPYRNAPEALLNRPVPALPECLAQGGAICQGVPSMLFTRLLFSALVDADFLATEAFMNPGQQALRPRPADDLLPQMSDLLDQHLARRFPPGGAPAASEATAPSAPLTGNDFVNRARAEVLAACRARAEEPPGLFSLTVPTGGGKTLSSLAFALRHAVKHGLQRVIYVVPFTSIIEQNAAVFEEVFAPLIESEEGPVVLQHHSNFELKENKGQEANRVRLATENWDAPLVVTTAVQFYESLHAARTSGCRKLHRIANAVVILDEAQCLPVEYLRPCLDLLRELTTRYRTTAVLCTATQPEIGRNERFKIGLENVREIVPDPVGLYQILRRVEVRDRGTLDDATLAAEIGSFSEGGLAQVLAIVNTRDHAREVFRLLPKAEGENFHLSARMCPAHRRQVLDVVRVRLEHGEPVRLISTQLIEAGVDVDFPRVYRALAGIDSLAQAAGRCNRNGRLAMGELHVFRSEHQRAEAYFRETAQIAERVLDRHKDDPLGLESVRRFFTLYYQGHCPPKGQPWDAEDITGCYRVERDKRAGLPFQFQFAEVAERFRLIEDNQVSVIVPFDERAEGLLKDLRNESIPLHRSLLRGLQRYTVQIRERDLREHKQRLESVRDDQFHILSFQKIDYSSMYGLLFGDNSPFLYAGV